MTVQIRDSSAITLLRSVPRQVGYRPRESLVLVPISGRETCGVLRIDLPRTVDLDRCASAAVACVRRIPQADALIIIVYTDAPALDGSGVAYEALTAAVIDRADDLGLRVTGEFCIGADGWTSYRDPKLRALDEIEDGGDPPARNAREGTEVPRSNAADRREVARCTAALNALSTDALAWLRPGPRRSTGHSELDLELEAFATDPHALFEAALADPRTVPPARAALWLWVLTCPAMRDVVLTQWVGDATEARRTHAWQEAWLAGVSDQPDFPVRLAGDGPRPDAERVHRAREFVRAFAGRAPTPQLSACLAVCGWLSWALGSSSLAAEFAERAIELTPRATFPALILEMTDAGVLPGWAFDPDGQPLTAPWLLANV
ncbi:MAG: DUF4192 family protein [Candidatus Microbacterium stercoravium]